MDNDILPCSVLSQMIDKQSAPITMKFFSKEVEDKMVELEEIQEERNRKKVTKSSYFVKCIREWYAACDSRGLDPGEMIRKMMAFDELLTQDVDSSSFPPPGNYIKGIPVVTYEGILMNNAHRYNHYYHLKDGYYNQRAFSTLNVENFFGYLTAMEFSGLGCPKSTDICCLMSHTLQLTHHRLDATQYICNKYTQKY